MIFPLKIGKGLYTGGVKVWALNVFHINMSFKILFLLTLEKLFCSFNRWLWLLNLLTPWSGVFLVQLTCSQLVEKFPAFYGIWRFIAKFTRACPYIEPDQFSLYSLSNFLKIYFNITLSCMPTSSKWSLSIKFPHQNPVCSSPLLHTVSFSSTLYGFLHSPAISSLLGPNILLNPVFSNTLGLYSSLSVSDQVSHPYKTTSKIIVLYILILHFWIANWKTKVSAANCSKQSLTSVCS